MKSKIKIGLVLSGTPGYSETFFISKIKGLQEAGFEVVLFVDKKTTKFDLCAVYEAYSIHKGNLMHFFMNCIKVVFNLILSPRGFVRFVRLELKEHRNGNQIIKNVFLSAHILARKVDWLHFGFATLAINKEHVAESIGAKMSMSLRGFDINVYPLKHNDCYKLVWKKLDKVHSISEYLLERAVNFGLSKDTGSKIITPAVDLKSLPKSNFKTSNKIKIVTIARFNWMKGLTIALHAMEILKSKSILFEYHIIGGGSKEEVERYAFQVNQLGLSEEVVFHGKLSHGATKKIVSNSHIYIQPSLSEGFCNAVLEAQAIGLLCIVSDGGALLENIIEGETGWSFSRGDYSQLAELIERVNEMDNSSKEMIIESAKKRIRAKFNIENQINEFVDFYGDK